MAKASDSTRKSKQKHAGSNKFLDLANSAKEVIITITALVSLIILIFGSGKIGTISTEQESIDFVKWVSIIFTVSLATFVAYSIVKVYQSAGKFVSKIINQDNIYAIIASISAGLLTAVYVSYHSGENWSTILQAGLLAGILAGFLLGIILANFMNFLYKKVLIPFHTWTKRLDNYAKSAFFCFAAFGIAANIPSILHIKTSIFKNILPNFSFKGTWNNSEKPWESYDTIGEFFILIAIIFIIVYGIFYVGDHLMDAAIKRAEAEAKRKEAEKKAKAAAKKKAKAKKEAAKKAEDEAEAKKAEDEAEAKKK